MIQTLQQQARIYLNESRGKHEIEWFRSFHSFNFGNYQQEHRQPFGDLYVLNDDTLAGGREIKLEAEECTQVLLLPVVGAVTCNNSFVHSGELLLMNLPAGSDLSIKNPYAKDEDLVNYLQLWFKTPDAPRVTSPSIKQFSFENNMGKMISLTAETNYPFASIGKYMGRNKDVYTLHDPSKAVYAFVIQGAFEVEDRLLHARDGLALEGFSSIEFEALSNEAILLLVEVTV